ncbi:hypothetical protein TTHERM_00310300 (macronuclear) [Tetrahymena thermophila SB210]|uniref:Transmembrane protein n=1 Tax=Tetrahymena thermophila (strain SB210) TaxID=312017 RepID=I7LW52_TETTS|nr:hypothetical protein TTHERM_00310300 [Tetrahymena thermophila SB210]EAS00860.1 hypothetical protein TTHERM_00310300 [Tetrahymena thermophila SB210]|eukprot:XP_001021105.1 hypothetical protein TTHERM_00310300 [Tetrahymena thermophila SB210]
MKQIFPRLLLSSYFLLQLVKSCDEIIQCEHTDPECLVQLRLFQTCVSSRCDSQNIESQNIEELSKCYSETCISKYEPINLSIQKYTNCMVKRIKKNSLHFNLPTLQTIFDPIIYSKCKRGLADSCIFLSSECAWQLSEQFECEKRCLPFEHYKMVEFCLSSICKPDLLGLQALNKQYVECLSQETQVQTSSSPSQPIAKSDSEILILSLIFLILLTITY